MDRSGGTTATQINAADGEVDYSPREGLTWGKSLNAPNCANITNSTSITLSFQGHKIEVYGDLSNNTVFGTMNVNYLDDNSNALASTAALSLPLLFQSDNIKAASGVTTNLLKIEVEIDGTNWFCVDHFMVYHMHQKVIPPTDSTTTTTSTNTVDPQASSLAAEQTRLTTTHPMSIHKQATATLSGTSTVTSELGPKVTTISTPTTTPPSQKNASKGGSAGGAVGGIVIIVVVVVFLIWRRRRKTRATPVLDRESVWL